jgi:enoyl-CoA hydratase/carnithine racemase
VSEVVAPEKLREAAAWAAGVIASAEPLSVQGTVRALWSALELPRQQALDMAYLYVRNGNDRNVMRAAQERFASGARVDWRVR